MADDSNMSADELEHEPAIDSDAYREQEPTWQTARHTNKTSSSDVTVH
jgi:hypothetical protein